jgi:hypothetical protein
MTLAAHTALYRVYDPTWGYDQHNPGFGDARFSPFDHPDDKHRIPSMYLAATQPAALLETVFHDVHHDSSRTIYERDLRGKLLACIEVPISARLGDLRDPELVRLHLARDQIASSPAEHYPCTRSLAVDALRQSHSGGPIQGLIWHSRQAELGGQQSTEVAVIFGDTYPSGRGSWPLIGPGARNLYEGPGRLLVDQLAEDLAAVVQPEG